MGTPEAKREAEWNSELEDYAANIRSTPHYKLQQATAAFLQDRWDRFTKAEQETHGKAGMPVITKLSEVEEKRVEWVWKGRIARGKLTLMDGDPGSLKSWVTGYLIARITKGDPLPGDEDQDIKRTPERVLILSEDDERDTIKPRIRIMGGNMDNIHILQGVVGGAGRVQKISLKSIATLRRVVEVYRPGVVIIDPVIKYLDPKMDTNKATDVRSTLDPLVEMAREFDCAVVCLRHLNKDVLKKAIYRGQGSMDFIGTARSVFCVMEHPDEPNVQVLCHTKVNNAPKAQSLTFRVEQSEDEIGRFHLGEFIDLTADEIAQRDQQGHVDTKLEVAKGFLTGFLSRGEAAQTDLWEHAAQAGITERTLKRAKAALPIQATKTEGGKWFWKWRGSG